MTRIRIDWSKFGRDLIVIILGVLIALGFDNLASARADRRLEVQYLKRLSRDLRADSVSLPNTTARRWPGQLPPDSCCRS